MSARQRRVVWLGVWLFGAVAGVSVLVAQSMARSLDAFETEARIAHRLLSQRAVQHEAVLATLSLMQPAVDPRLPAIYPQFLHMLRREAGQAWPGQSALAAALSEAEARGAGSQLARADLATQRFWIVMAPGANAGTQGASYALEVSLPLMVPWADWPFGDAADAPSARNTRVWLEQAGTRWAVHEGGPSALRRFEFRKHLAAASQPFELVAQRSYGMEDLPWLTLGLWLMIWSAVMAGLSAALHLAGARRRAEALLRLGQVSRLNALGELAAGLAHELNQPLTAVAANTQAAVRLLTDEPADLDLAKHAMGQAVSQAQRAAEVVARLRRVIERPNAAVVQEIDLAGIARGVTQLLAPECHKRGVHLVVEAPQTCIAWGDPVAVEQILHNLVLNSLAALAQVTGRSSELRVCVSADTRPSRVCLTVQDNGPGVPRELAGRLFEPFVSGRTGGLGLGLSLCETLALEMGGQLQFRPLAPGAEFTLVLPIAADEKQGDAR